MPDCVVMLRFLEGNYRFLTVLAVRALKAHLAPAHVAAAEDVPSAWVGTNLTDAVVFAGIWMTGPCDQRSKQVQVETIWHHTLNNSNLKATLMLKHILKILARITSLSLVAGVSREAVWADTDEGVLPCSGHTCPSIPTHVYFTVITFEEKKKQICNWL